MGLSTILLWYGKIPSDVYMWITFAVLGTSSVDKFKDEISASIKKKK